MDVTSIKGNIKPTIFNLQNGAFERDRNGPIKADGKFYRVPGSDYVDETSITIDGRVSVKQIDKIRGKIVYAVRYSVSDDGKTLTWDVTSYTGPSGEPVESKTVQRRVGNLPHGKHPISGKWEFVSFDVDEQSDWLLKLDGNHFSWRKPDMTGFDAVIGGKPVNIDGDASGALALITRPRRDTIVETDLSRSGKRLTVMKMKMLRDKDTIRGTAYNLIERKPTTFILRRVNK